MSRLISRSSCLSIAGLLMLAHTLGGVAGGVTMEMVTIGNPGNANDTHGAGYGGVSYVYNIGKYEVTAAQYTEFLNAVAVTDDNDLYDTGMAVGRGCKIQRTGSSGSYSYSIIAAAADRPVNHIAFADTLRFANWIHNGQPTGAQDATTTEDGAYDMSLGDSAVRKPGALFFLPSEDEWYKAAYYDPDKPGGPGYYNYPTGSDSVPGHDMNEATNPGNNANYYLTGAYPIDSPYYRTVAGEFELSDSPYGTFDQGSNVWEWNEAIIGSYRGLRGGAYNNGVGTMQAGNRPENPLSYGYDVGFRIAGIPEPAALLLLLCAAGSLACVRRRQR